MRLVLPGLLLVAALLVVPGALAHAEPWQSSPGSGERLAESPTEVVVSFTERIYEEGSWIEVWDLSGNRVDLGDLRTTGGDQPVMRISVRPLDEGPYLIKWQTYSETDGHTIRGAIGFSVGGFAPPEAQDSADDVPVGAGIARALTYMGYVAAVGAIAFDRVVLRDRKLRDASRTVLDGAMMAGAVFHLAGLTWLLFHTSAATGIGLGAFLASAGGRDLWVRVAVAFALTTLSALWLYGPARPRATQPILAVLWVVAIGLGARFGHGLSASSWFVQTVHGAAIASWLGGLLLLFIHLIGRGSGKKEAKAVQELGRRFSTLAIAAVTAMAVTGLALSLTILGTSFFDIRLWAENPWRTFLSIKILLVLVMIVLAVINREVFLASEDEVGPVRRRVRRFADRFLRWQDVRSKGGTSDFRNVVAVEAVFGVAVLVCAGFLMSVAAPTQGLESSAASYETTGTGDHFTALLQVSPEPASGHFSDVRIYIQTDEEDPQPLESNTCIGEGQVRDDCIRFTWWPDGQAENNTQETIGIPEGDGWWLFERVLWSSAGLHHAVVDLSTERIYADSIPLQVDVLQSTASDPDTSP